MIRFGRIEEYDGGIGVYASRDISRGEVLVREAPLVRAASVEELDEAVSALSDIDRRRFFSLYCPQPKTSLGIFQSNGFPCGDKAGVMLKSSRFNHSCRPNCSHKWTENEFVVVAARDSKANEELCISYIDLEQSTEERRRELKNFGFFCGCKACECGENRTELKKLDDEIFVLASRGDPRALEKCEERHSLLQLFRLDFPANMVRLCHDAVQAAENASLPSKKWKDQLKYYERLYA